MKLIKSLLWLVVFLVVAVLAAGYFADGIARSAIESAATEALGVPTTVESVDIGFFGGTFEMKGKKIANPEGFGDGPFFELGGGKVEVSATSLLSDKIELPLLELSKVRVHLIQGMKGSNYGTILDNLKKFQGEPEAEKEAGEGKRFVIRKLVIEDVEVDVVPVKELNLGALKLPIDRIELHDVGSDSDKGVLLSELAGIVVEAVMKRASTSGRLPDLIRGPLQGKVGRLQGLADALPAGALPGGALPGSAKEAEQALKEGLKKDLDKRLKGVLGN